MLEGIAKLNRATKLYFCYLQHNVQRFRSRLANACEFSFHMHDIGRGWCNVPVVLG